MPHTEATEVTEEEDSMEEDEVTGKILEAAFKVHTELGPGLLESVFEVVLAHEIRKIGLEVERQVVIPIVYDGIPFEAGFRADLIVNDLVIVESKAVEALNKVHGKQLPTQLRLSKKAVGLAAKFFVPSTQGRNRQNCQRPTASN